ncbi:MAG: hypothetical protein COT84_08020 [Chlamydiae bacterium CG10_big_fil_rev_8_21_14_0_10_35_9]|nr:MAG: hypothetical protein COT84_08020 [Chlamydiae bacterium CG10_big_fil_rev_8_21_14_0_10_35_9]
MTPLINLSLYICYCSTNLKTLLSKARLVKLIYLVDWKSAINNKQQITDIKWIFNHYGPYVKEIINELDKSSYFVIQKYINNYGNTAEKISLKEPIDINKANQLLSEKDRKIVDYVLSVTKHMNYTEFLKLIYSTYPILKSNRQDKMDLVLLAEEYKQNYKR